LNSFSEKNPVPVAGAIWLTRPALFALVTSFPHRCAGRVLPDMNRTIGRQGALDDSGIHPRLKAWTMTINDSTCGRQHAACNDRLPSNSNKSL